MIRLAFCVEDSTDQVCYQILISRILAEPVLADEKEYRLRRGGWTTAIALARAHVEHAWSAGLDGVLLAIDNDGDEPHAEGHSSAGDHSTCRLCRLQHASGALDIQRRERASPFSVITAVPVRILETWLLLSRGYAFVGRPEDHGLDALGRQVLKRELYGTPRPDRTLVASISVPICENVDAMELAARSASFKHFKDQVTEMKAAIPASRIELPIDQG
jgi:hypothetical protein